MEYGMNRITSRLAMAVLAVTLSAQTATAQPYVYTGTTVGGPRWNRPKIDFYGGSTAVPYSAFGFSVYRSGTHSFLSQATTSWDNYLYLYEAAADGDFNLLIQNDDLNGTAGLSGFDFVLDRNNVYFLVTTGYKNIDAGVFSNSITGPSEYVFTYCCFQLPESTVPDSTVPESTVPEPSTYALMAAGLLALGVTARKRRAMA